MCHFHLAYFYGPVYDLLQLSPVHNFQIYISYLIVTEYTAVFLENVLKSAAIFDLLAVAALRHVVPIPVGEHCSVLKELEEFIVKCLVN